MKKSQYEYFVCYLFAFLFVGGAFFCNGCGLVSMVVSPTRHEKKIPAEYKLREQKDKKILVLVDQPARLNAAANLRYYLTRDIREYLVKKIRIPAKGLISYENLVEFRNNQANFSLMSPLEVGKVLQADIVLVVVVEDFRLYNMAESGFLKGFLSSRAVILDATTGEKVWPKSFESKEIKVGFEFDERNVEIAVSRLTAASAHCITRYFYDCPMDKFRIADDRSGEAWENW
ncbi:MAG: hypothetical protein ACYS9Y_10075 [Planctomycetota bacterium]|jgi:hypothetical protein